MLFYIRATEIHLQAAIVETKAENNKDGDDYRIEEKAIK
jgi:hypothetical protein